MAFIEEKEMTDQAQKHPIWKLSDFKRANPYDQREMENTLDAVVEIHLPLVKYIATEFCSITDAVLDYAEIYNAGLLGLLNAIEEYDIERDEEFSVYCTNCIVEAINQIIDG